MKKLLLLVGVLVFVSCGKHKFENKIQGEWKLKEARLESMESWASFPTTEDIVKITNDSISNPWNTSYSVIDKNLIFMNNQVIKVKITKHNMLWVFENTDSLRLIR